MKKNISILLLSLFSAVAFSQRIGEWNTYFSYENDINIIVQGEDEIYALTDGKLFSYSPEYDSYETYSRINGGDISHIAYSSKYKCVIIIRTNGDIDLQYSKDRFTNIPGMKNLVQNLDKTVNGIYVSDDYAYISTNFGLVVLNLKKEEIKESVIARYPFYSACIYNDLLYAVTEEGIKRIDPKLNIQYLDNWEEISFIDNYEGNNEYSFSDTEARQLTPFDNKLLFIVPGKAIYTYDGGKVESRLEGWQPHNIVSIGKRVVVFQPYYFWTFSDLNSYTTNRVKEGDIIEYIFPDKEKTNEFWVALMNGQLSAIKINSSDNSYDYIEEIKNKRPNGPLSNYAYFLKYESRNKKLYFTGGRALNNGENIPGQLSEFSKNIWFNYDKKEIDAFTDKDSKDFVSVANDPKDAEHFFLGTWGTGLIEFKDKKPVKVYDERDLSLEIFDQWTDAVVNTMSYDKSGNLWIINTMADNPVKLLPNGQAKIVSINYPILTQQKVIQKLIRPRKLFIDQYNNKWLLTAFGYNDFYLFIFNTGDNLTNTADDKTKFVDTFADQDGNVYPKNTFVGLYDIAEDHNGNIWLGTGQGVFVVYNSRDQIFNRDFVLNKIKIPRNDGTNNADILLEGVQVNTIAVDGANRKWIGTLSGLYVVSANGQEIYHHFNMENSLLPSNEIWSLAIDHATGIVYIGTDKGLVSYKGEATEGYENYSNVYVYPNPVHPEYDGPIAIKGLKANSTVKITDVKGNLIHQGTSLGGQYIWDGKNVKRERVDTGVYIIFGASEEGDEGAVTKVMVISE